MAKRTVSLFDKGKMYALYLGQKRIFPNGESVDPNVVYEIEPMEPRTEWGGILNVLVHTTMGSIYVPYPSMREVYADWMPYDGSDIL